MTAPNSLLQQMLPASQYWLGGCELKLEYLQQDTSLQAILPWIAMVTLPAGERSAVADTTITLTPSVLLLGYQLAGACPLPDSAQPLAALVPTDDEQGCDLAGLANAVLKALRRLYERHHGGGQTVTLSSTTLLQALASALEALRCDPEQAPLQPQIDELEQHFHDYVGLHYVADAWPSAGADSSSSSATDNKPAQAVNEGAQPQAGSSLRPFLAQLCYVKLATLTLQGDADVAAAKLPRTVQLDVLDILAALLATPTALKVLSDKWPLKPATIRFPQAVYQLRESIVQAVPLRTFTASQGHSSDWFSLARQHSQTLYLSLHAFFAEQRQPLPSQLSLLSFIERLLKLAAAPSALPALKHWQQANTQVTLSQLAQRSQGLEAALKAQVQGQHDAIHDVLQSHLHSTFSSAQGLRSLMTFLGPTGVGKTLLAQAYASALAEYEHTGYSCRIFNMESYADDKALGNLFGSGAQYHDSALGQLTTQVLLQPRTVLIFDEIEKAHPTVIQSLLTLLDTGAVRDNTTAQLIDFSQAIVIFTSNLGHREFAKAHQLGELDVYSILAHAKRPGGAHAALSPELINRLRRGQTAVFKPLSLPAMVTVAERELQRLMAEDSPLLEVQLPPDFARLLLFAQLPDASLRGLHGVATDILAEAQRQVLKQPALQGLKTMRFSVCDSCWTTPVERYRIAVLDAELLPQLPSHARIEWVKAMPNVSQRDCDGWLVTANFAAEVSPQSLAELVSKPLFCVGIHLQPELDATTQPEWLQQHAWQCSTAVTKQELGQWLAWLDLQWRWQDAKRRQLAFKFELACDEIKGASALIRVINPQFKRIASARQATLGVPGLLEQRPEVKLTDIIGLERAKDKLQRVIQWMQQVDRLPGSAGMPGGVLLSGPPGTGKTMLAQAVAGECELPFLNLKVGELVSSLAHGTAQNLQKAFSAAADIAPCVIFIDEIDAIAGARGAGSFERSAVNTLLTELDGLQARAEPILVIAATNAPELLDAALLRAGRLDEHVHCDLPNKRARHQFLQQFIAANALHTKFTLSAEDIATWVDLCRNMSGAEVQQALKESLFQASLTASGEVSLAVMQQAITNVRYGRAQVNDVLSDAARRQVAYHEAGHLLASKLLMPSQRVTFVTIEPRNQVLGFVASQRDESLGPTTRSEIQAQLAVLMAGREAERFANSTSARHDISIGAAGDLDQASKLAYSAVCELGLDEEFGSLALTRLANPSSALRELAETRVRAWLQQAQQQAAQLMAREQQRLQQIATVLLQEESLYGDAIDVFFR